MIKQYNITDYIKDDPELQKAVIEEFLNDIKRLQAENERLKEENLQLQTIDMEIDRNNKYRKALEEIQKMFSEPCIEGENCFTCNSNCSNKDVLNITTEVLK